MRWKPPFKILGSSDSVVAQKKLIFIFFRIIISLEKNPRKPVSISREEIRDFKLLKHIKLLVTDSRGCTSYMNHSLHQENDTLPYWAYLHLFDLQVTHILGLDWALQMSSMSDAQSKSTPMRLNHNDYGKFAQLVSINWVSYISGNVQSWSVLTHHKNSTAYLCLIYAS